MKTLPKTGFIGIDESLNKYSNSPAALAKLERDKESFSKIKDLHIVKKYKD